MNVMATLLAISTISGARPASAGSLADALRSYAAAYAARASARAAPADPIPSFTRQTGLACNVCHSSFPQLTSFGRRFKLNGYTLTGLQVVTAGDTSAQSLKISLIPPVSAMAQVSVTQIKTPRPGTQNGNAEFPQELSVFLGEEISPRMGTFLQLTYEGAEGSVAIDNAEIRYANHARLGAKDLLYGFTLNNNPSVQDVWNTTPVWGYPYASSSVAPTPSAGVLLDEQLGQQVAGFGTYALWNSLLYGEFTVYRSAPQGGAHPPDSTAESNVRRLAPYWRVALQHGWGSHYVEVGTFGMSAELYPTGVAGRWNRFTDWAVDGQYEQTLGEGSLTAHATWIHERQTLDAAFAAGESQNSFNTLDVFRANAVIYTASRVGGALGYFSTTGTSDAERYAPEPVDGSATGSPNSAGMVAELNFMPWLNTRFGLQYVAYTKFNGAKTGYDGSGRNASDNNTIYLLAWLAF